MSFRRRLTLFFLLIVALPMVAVAVLVVDVADESSSGKADARLGALLENAIAIHDAEIADARAAGALLGTNPDLVAALASRDRARVRRVARDLGREHDATALRVTDRRGRRLAAIGDGDPIATARIDLTARDGGRPVGAIEISTTTPAEYVAAVRRQTRADGVLADEQTELASTVSTAGLELPPPGSANDIEVDGETLRAASAALPGSGELRLALLGDIESGGFFASSPRVGAALAIFFVIALIFVAMLARALQGQVSTMLDAARGIGEGDFSLQVPVVGRDEMAGLASEFNKMSTRLSEQMGQLRRQQVEIERSVRRIGEASASGLDRHALLTIVVETAVGACGAEYGLVALSGRAGAEVEVGTATEMLQEAALAAEERASRERDVSEASADGSNAIAGPLGRIGRPDKTIGVMTVARADRPFTSAERDVFRYLLGQASASVENVALHEMVSAQAVTDELTGLANKRAFGDLIEKEAARAERFGHDLSLLMLDIDDFKEVNDTHGHLQGDEVLRTVGRILTSESRGVDEPARYGGEEFVVALPETDTEGALELGERIRARIESEPVPSVNGDGEIRITASFGAATIPSAANDVSGLIAAADSALYDAKRAGKNRVRPAADRASGKAGDGTPASGRRGAKGRAGGRRS